MTLSRGPYTELDKMSLFQDLKLKRRKVDSRCSSDGESVADTSTSSPDILTPLSPKMCDQQSHHNNHMPTTPTPPDLTQDDTTTKSPKVNTCGNGAQDRVSPDSPALHEEVPSTTSIKHEDEMHISSHVMLPGSVIRSVQDERPRSTSPISTQIEGPIQQHVTVLVAPSKIKQESQTSTIVRNIKNIGSMSHEHYSSSNQITSNHGNESNNERIQRLTPTSSSNFLPIVMQTGVQVLLSCFFSVLNYVIYKLFFLS